MSLQTPYPAFQEQHPSTPLGELQTACIDWIYDELAVIRGQLISVVDSRWQDYTDGGMMTSQEFLSVDAMFDALFEGVRSAAADRAIPGFLAKTIQHDTGATPRSFQLLSLMPHKGITNGSIGTAEELVDDSFTKGKTDVVEREIFHRMLKKLFLELDLGSLQRELGRIKGAAKDAARNVGIARPNEPELDVTALQTAVPCYELFLEFIYAQANNAFDMHKGSAQNYRIDFSSDETGVTMRVQNDGGQIPEAIATQLAAGERVEDTPTSGVRMMEFKQQFESLEGGGHTGSITLEENTIGEVRFAVFIPHGEALKA